MTKAAELAKMGEVLTNSQIGGRRNIIINGAMQVAQRGTSSTGLGASSGYFVCDRWNLYANGTAGRLTMAQVADIHDGFANALKLTCTTADTSIAAGEQVMLMYRIEGQDLQQLKKGTSDAERVTLSFYVKGNASATYIAELMDADNSNRHVNASFNVTTDWTRVAITFPADTTGTLDDDNAVSLDLMIHLHNGSNFTSGTLQTTWGSLVQANRGVGGTSFFDSTDRTFFITGVQLEVGEQATPFEHRSFGEELALCQRYLQKYTGVTAIKTFPHTSTLHSWNDNNASNGMVSTTTTMRAAPTITESGLRLRSNNHGNFDGTFAFESITVDGAHTAVSGASGLNTGRFYNISSTNTSSYIQLDAEL